jgi:hypothetical protein
VHYSYSVFVLNLQQKAQRVATSAVSVMQVISSLTPQMVGYTVMVLGFSCMILVRSASLRRQTPLL